MDYGGGEDFLLSDQNQSKSRRFGRTSALPTRFLPELVGAGGRPGQTDQALRNAAAHVLQIVPRTGICRTDDLITHEIAQQDTSAAEQESDVRWLVEPFHREIKQVTGIESCQCRKSRSQRNHVALAALTWVRLKHLAYQAKTTVYQLKQGLLDAYMTRELTAPTLVFA